MKIKLTNLGLAILGVSTFVSLLRITYLNYTEEMNKKVLNKSKSNSVANDKRGNTPHIMASPNTIKPAMTMKSMVTAKSKPFSRRVCNVFGQPL